MHSVDPFDPILNKLCSNFEKKIGKSKKTGFCQKSVKFDFAKFRLKLDFYRKLHVFKPVEFKFLYNQLIGGHVVALVRILKNLCLNHV